MKANVMPGMYERDITHEVTNQADGEAVDLAQLLGVLAGAGERIVTHPDQTEPELRRMVLEARNVLGLGYVGLRAKVSERREVYVEDGVAQEAMALEMPLRSGEAYLGMLLASPGSAASGGVPSEEQKLGLRAVAAHCALIVDAARARQAAAVRAAHESVVQLASEALGTILDENQLHKTVLVLTLELLGASGGVIFVDGECVASLGLENDERLVRKLGMVEDLVERPRQKSWRGQVEGFHALGMAFGRSGKIFLVREDGPYTASEEASLKLVARQFARARERSQLHAILEKTTMDAIAALAAALEKRDGTTGEHIQRAQNLTGMVAETLGLPPEQVRTVRYATVLHDVGKIGIPDAILNKPGKLDEAEWTLMRRHPRIGADILSRIEGFERVSEVVLAHHERFDGGGYPDGKAGEEIPIEARIISVVDTYDAMTNDRPYRKSLSPEEALAELLANSGSQFDPEVVEALKFGLSEKETADRE